MKNIKLNTEYLKEFISENEISEISEKIISADESLKNKSGKGNDFLGWMDLPDEIKDNFISEIRDVADDLRIKSEVIVVIGIGGSYLGAKAIIEALTPAFKNDYTKGEPEILFAGFNLSSEYHYGLLNYLKSKEYSVIVISKSGTTTEPAIAFRLIKKQIEEKYGRAEASKRIVAVTDKSKGALRKLSEQENYKTFVIPDDVGGRFSVLTPVGLLPIACAGINISEIVIGAVDMRNLIDKEKDIFINPAYLYSGIRNILYSKNKEIEILVSYEPSLVYITEWWKQLYGESEGKNGKGLFTASVNFTTDLHSLGQLIQDGKRNLFETVISIKNKNEKIEIPLSENDTDDLNYISGKKLSYVNDMAMLGTIQAHTKGNCPNLIIEIPEISGYYLGQLIYFFERACGISGYVLGVNPFDQPGVEEYKSKMFKLLGKK
ncbi:MAG: glucose-6-phosphate isomerase [Ignavibacteria bacterium]|nr:glucose-6-phosphate isomerase [Ignavibacteria bacterium]